MSSSQQTFGTVVSVAASHHQGDSRYVVFSRDEQCTANSVAAVAVFATTAVETWQMIDPESILSLGDTLYKVARQRGVPHDDLCPDLVPTEFTHENWRYSLNIGHAIHSGVHSDNTSTQLSIGLQKFFQNEIGGVVVSCNLTFAIYTLPDGRYVLFDSHKRNRNGRYRESGTAVITYHSTIFTLAETIANNLSSLENRLFSICSVKVTSFVPSSQQTISEDNSLISIQNMIFSKETTAQRKSRMNCDNPPILLQKAIPSKKTKAQRKSFPISMQKAIPSEKTKAQQKSPLISMQNTIPFKETRAQRKTRMNRERQQRHRMKNQVKESDLYFKLT